MLTTVWYSTFSVSYQVSLILLYQIHFVYQAKDFGFWRILQNGLKTWLIVVHVLLKFAALHIKDINQNLNISKDVVTLASEIIFHEGVLSGRKENLDSKQILCSITPAWNILAWSKDNLKLWFKEQVTAKHVELYLTLLQSHNLQSCKMFLFCCCCFWDLVSLCIAGWTGIHYIEQAGLKFMSGFFPFNLNTLTFCSFFEWLMAQLMSLLHIPITLSHATHLLLHVILPLDFNPIHTSSSKPSYLESPHSL